MAPAIRHGRWGRVVVGATAVGASYLLVRTGRAAVLDDAVASVLRRPLGREVDRLVAVTTDLGSVYGLGGAAAVLAATGRRSAALDVAASGLAAWCGAQAVKPLLDRQRPYEQDEAARLVSIPAGTSWPSGHAAVAAAIGTAATDHGGPAVAATGVGLVAFVSASRVYVGVHHATDPLAGVGIGILSATLWRWLRRRFRGTVS